MFSPNTENKSAAHAAINTRPESAYTVVDFLAALAFIIGSLSYFLAK